MRKILVILCLLVFVAGAFFLLKENQKPAVDISEGLNIRMLDIGQGDSILIQGQGKTILVDTGPPGSKERILADLKKYNVAQIDILIITHPHADHNGNAAEILNKIPVGIVYESPTPSSSPIVKKIYTTMKSKNVNLKIPVAGEKIQIADGAYIEFLTPIEGFGKVDNLNNGSLVFMLVCGDTKILFTGDGEKELESKLVSIYGNKLKAQILKAPHHGSRTSSSEVFLNTVKPEVALISCEKGNDYGHPHKEVMNRYSKYGIRSYRTDTQGDLSVIMNGKGYKVSSEKEGDK